MDEPLFTVRAIPLTGHTTRWRAQRPWTKTPVTVKVVDSPTPVKIETDRDGKSTRIYSDEISPLDLAELQSDPHIAVSPVGGAGDVDATAHNDLKVKIVELEKLLTKLRKEHQDVIEELQMEKASSNEQAEKAGARVAQLEHELSVARAQLGKKAK